MNRPLGFLTLSLLPLVVCPPPAEHSRNPTSTLPAPATDNTIKQFLKRYCTRCHSKSKHKGDVVLAGISFDLAAGHDMRLWKTVLEQLVLGEMPPAKKKQPQQQEKGAVIRWITAELDKSGNASDIYAKLESPSYGNYVNHEKLFSGEVQAESFSPARLWRTSPHVFDNIKSGYGGETRHLRQPFLLEDKMGIKDYANMLFADSAVVNTPKMLVRVSRAVVTTQPQRNFRSTCVLDERHAASGAARGGRTTAGRS